jgi:putative membrane protein
MQHRAYALIAAGLLAATQAVAAPSPADRNFAMKAAQGGLAEVQDGQLAAQRGTSSQVKQFGQRMVTDHGQANQELQQIADQENLILPTKPGAAQQSESRRLSGMSGTGFDNAYMRDALQGHQQDVAAFRREAQSGQDPALKEFAQKYLPIVQRHLQLAQSLGTQR